MVVVVVVLVVVDKKSKHKLQQIQRAKATVSLKGSNGILTDILLSRVLSCIASCLTKFQSLVASSHKLQFLFYFGHFQVAQFAETSVPTPF